MTIARQAGAPLTAMALIMGLAGAAEAASTFSLDYIGQATFATGTMYDGTEVGGLSGIDYNPAANSYIAISDDRSSDARFYGLMIDLADGMLNNGDVTFTSVTNLTQAGGVPYVGGSIDPESIRYQPTPANGIVWSSEGDASQTPPISPAVFQANAAGQQTLSLPIPTQFIPQPSATPPSGVRNNLAFESLTYSADKTKLYTAVEDALVQDGPSASLASGSPSRVIEFNSLGNPGRQFVYVTDPIALPPNPSDAFATNGLVEMLALDENHFLMLERSFSAGATGTPGDTGNTVKLYLASIDGATDVQSRLSLEGESYVPMSKELVIDFTSLGIPIDNVEGMTFGETLADGTRTLIFVSDNNFNSTQFTQFLAFSIAPAPVPLPAALPLFAGGIAVIAAFACRRG